MTPPAIKLTSVGKRHSDALSDGWLFHDINLEVAAGERLVLVGPNGSGKSTLLRLLLAAEEPDAGNISAAPELSAVRIGYVPQDYRNAFFPWLRLAKNLTLSVRAAGDGWNSRFDALTNELHLSLDLQRYPYQLSGGEQQLFLLIQALVRQPSLLVVDEPFSAVDTGRKKIALASLGQFLTPRTCTMVAVTHDFGDAITLADRILVLSADSSDVRAMIEVPFRWPRDYSIRLSEDFLSLVNRITEATL